MPSFDVVSEVDLHALTNAVDQSSRVIVNRFDFKGVDAEFQRSERAVTLLAEADFQLDQMLDMLRAALIKCDIDPLAMEPGDRDAQGKQVRQTVVLTHGISADIARKMVRRVKDSKLKVQTQIQGDQLRVTGKKRDDLQQVMALLREGDFGQPLQFTNLRD